MIQFPRTSFLIYRVFGAKVQLALSTVFNCLRMAWTIWVRDGYAKSAFQYLAQDGDGNPIPWYSYPAIAYLSRLDWRGVRVCEFGGGQSTRWYAARGAVLTVRETSEMWAGKIREAVPAATVEYGYSIPQIVANIPEADVYCIDSWMIDGQTTERLRGEIAHAIVARKAKAMVILDNAETVTSTHDILAAAAAHWVSFDGWIAGGVMDRTTIYWMDAKNV